MPTTTPTTKQTTSFPHSPHRLAAVAAFTLTLAAQPCCDPTPPPTMLPTDAVRQPYCGGKGATKRWDADCVSRCIPDEQIFATCTEKMGRVFNTRQGLLLAQSYGWTWETGVASAQRCGDYTARVWKLTLIWPQPTAATVFGRVTTTETSGECSDRVMTPMSVATGDRLYYTADEVVGGAGGGGVTGGAL